MQCLLFLLLREKDDVETTYFHFIGVNDNLGEKFQFLFWDSRKLIKKGGKNQKLTIGRGRLFGTLRKIFHMWKARTSPIQIYHFDWLPLTSLDLKIPTRMVIFAMPPQEN